MEHSFRAFDKDKNIMIDDYMQEIRSIYPDVMLGTTIHNKVWHIGKLYNTLMLYSPIRDKNKVKVCEGDIIKSVAIHDKASSKGAITTSIVKLWQGNFCLCNKDNESGISIFPFNVTSSIEVIGNIYQNPELMENVQ